jgi:hypothetical protein
MTVEEVRAILRTARELGITEDGFAPTHDVKAALVDACAAGFNAPVGATAAHLVGAATGWLQDKGYAVTWDAKLRQGAQVRDQPKVWIARLSSSIDRNVNVSNWCGDGDEGRAVALLQLIAWVKP